MSTKSFFMVILILVTVVSCEKVIDIPLNEAAQTIVVEAQLDDEYFLNRILLSKSGSVYEEENFPKIEGATVVVRDDEGGEWVFEEVGVPGSYAQLSFNVQPNTTYSLEVTVEDEVITSSSATNSKPKIDSLTYFEITDAFGVPPGDTLYLISFHSVDPVDENNFYMCKIYRNGTPNGGYYLGNDDFINGISYSAQFFGSEAESGDNVLVEMISMDEANYNYFVGLSNNLSSDNPFAASPANPPSNIQGNALGLFGTYTRDTMSIKIP